VHLKAQAQQHSSSHRDVSYPDTTPPLLRAGGQWQQAALTPEEAAVTGKAEDRSSPLLSVRHRSPTPSTEARCWSWQKEEAPSALQESHPGEERKTRAVTAVKGEAEKLTCQ